MTGLGGFLPTVDVVCYFLFSKSKGVLGSSTRFMDGFNIIHNIRKEDNSM